MLTRYILHISDEDYILADDDLKNWDAIKCSYKRSSYDAIVRSFTSEFEFVNRAAELVMSAYMQDAFNAVASIEVQTITDRWNYETRFACPLDFSSISWEQGVVKISALDNDLTALIKANKSTTYEFVVGKEVPTWKNLMYDRMIMRESATYEFTDGIEQYEDSSDIAIRVVNEELPIVGVVNSEICVNGLVEFKDDQESDLTSYVIKAHKDVIVRLDYDLAYRSDKTSFSSIFSVIHRNFAGEKLAENVMIKASATGKKYVNATSVEELPEIKDSETHNRYAIINGMVWVEGYSNWYNTNETPEQYFTLGNSGTYTYEMSAGDILRIVASSTNEYNKTRFCRNKMTFSWSARGNKIDISTIRPVTLLRKLLEKIGEGKMKIGAEISDYDPRLKTTLILAAESIRDIPDAKIYTSFNDFCTWMEVVFGYVYKIVDGSEMVRQYVKRAPFVEIVSNPYQLKSFYSSNVDSTNIRYDAKTNKFFAYADGEYYQRWLNDYDYFDNSGNPRSDVVYQTASQSYVYVGGMLIPYDIQDYNDGNYDKCVRFVHRSEIFGADTGDVFIPNVRNAKYSIDSSMLYSSIKIGYEHHDYETVNGRDEFNFFNEYTTGYACSTKQLTMVSKYRADCYGLEYCAQKRGTNTTDSNTDKDIFFVKCIYNANNDDYIVDRTDKIEGVSSTTLFNAQFSPIQCVRANEGYICIMAQAMTLTLASCDGNSDAIINGVKMSDNIALANSLCTAAELEFSTDEIPDNINVDAMVNVTDCGVTYRGYIKDVDFKFAKAESVKYNLIVKSIEQ